MIRRGFTLLEIMVVVMLIALAGSAVMMSLPVQQDKQLQQEAERLYRLLLNTAEQAEINGEWLGVILTVEGYELVRYQQGTWLAYSEKQRPVKVTLPRGLRLRWVLDAEDEQEESKTLSLHRTSLEMNQSAAVKMKPTPQLWFTPTPETPSFRIWLTRHPTEKKTDIADDSWQIVGSTSGKLELLPPTVVVPRKKA